MNFVSETLAEGNITKLIIRAGTDKKIEWEKGMNAKFHYTVHAFVPTSAVSGENSHSVGHVGHCCSKKIKADNLAELIKQAKGRYQLIQALRKFNKRYPRVRTTNSPFCF